METELTKEQVVEALRVFKARRDNLLHEDDATFEHHLQRFAEMCRINSLVQRVLIKAQSTFDIDVEAWLANACKRDGKLEFPADPNDELILRFRILERAAEDPGLVLRLGLAQRAHKRSEWVPLFLSVILRPFADDLSHRIGEEANLATPEARSIQAVPFNRIPGPKETKIFLSHKSIDKPVVYRYYDALKELGFEPWLDEPNMAAGANLHRELLRGFEESCAAVFFITANFKDENYLATEVDYAVMQKHKKDKKFAIITLRYTDASPVPGLLRPYIYKDVANDLEGFRELVRALPIEVGPARWKAEVV